MKIAFSSADGSALSATLAFDDAEYANFDFFDSSRRDVLLHLSFRFRRQVMVYNQFIGEKWGDERPTPLDLAPSGNALRVEVFLGIATVILDGRKVGAFELPEPSDGSAHALHWVTVNGGARQIEISGEAHAARRGRGMIVSDKPFLVEGWGYDPGSVAQALDLVVAETGDTLPLAVLPAPDRARDHQAPTDRIGVMGLIPGRIWHHVGATAEAAALQLRANGRPCGTPLTVTRAEVAEIIERLCEGDFGANTLEALTALEHARFGALAPVLSLTARRKLAEVAARYRVEAFYTPPVEAAPAALPLASAVRAEGDTESDESRGGAPQTTATAATETLAAEEASDVALPSTGGRADPLADALTTLAAHAGGTSADRLTAALAAFDLSSLAPNAQRALLRRLCGAFCAQGRFDDLFARAASHALTQLEIGAAGGEVAAALPFLYREGRGAALLAAMARLARHDVEPDADLDMAALGWTVRHMLSERPPFLTEEQSERMIDGALAIVERRAEPTKAEPTSPAATEMAVALVEALPTFTDDLQDSAARRIAATFGVSPAFWARVDEGMTQGRITRLPPDLADARARFAAFRDAVESDALAEALRTLGSTAWARAPMLREVAGAALSQGLPMAEALALTRRATPRLGPAEADDALLRHLAFPAEIADAPDLAAEGRLAIRRTTPLTPRAQRADVQMRAGQLATALLAPAGLDAVERTATLDAFFEACALLGTERHDYLGPALALSLLSGALTNRDAALAADVPPRLATLLGALSPDEQSAMTATHAVRSALWGLRQAPNALRDAAAQTVLTRFEAVMEALPPDVDPAAPGLLLPQTGIAAFFGVLVVVYSCRPNLATRLPALRATWLADLEARGIPHVVVVGDGDGSRDGDVVHLDAPDSYEGLPRKSLALVEWGVRRTGFAHVFKVDDDCFVDVERAIGGLAYRRHAYFGRPCLHNRGDTDRLWHHVRGSVSNASLELDKSAEPSEYANGATGYALNRRALQDIVDTSSTPHGAWLQLVSFLEDKLIGDTLSLTGLAPSSRDYTACVLRRSVPGGRPVCYAENGFLPSEASPALVAHLDDTSLLAEAAETRRRAVLRPKRLWPSTVPARAGHASFQLQLVSTQAQLDRVNAAAPCVVSAMRNERRILPAFLEHYREMGVEGFLICDNGSNDDTLAYLEAQPDVAVFSSDTYFGLTRRGLEWQLALVSQLRMGRWSLVASADEFLVLPQGADTLGALLSLPEFEGADCARLLRFDLYPEGPITEATLDEAGPLDALALCDSAPLRAAFGAGPGGPGALWTSAARHRLFPDAEPAAFAAEKHALVRYRPWMRFGSGLHHASDVRLARRDLVLAHARYHAGFAARAEAEAKHEAIPERAAEYGHMAARLAEGLDRVDAPGLSVPWRDCAWVRTALGATGKLSGKAAAE